MAIILLLLWSLNLKEIHCQYTTNEKNLRSAILAGYDTDIRPSEVTPVRTALGLMSLNKLDMGAQMMSLTVFWYTIWFDSRVQWDPAMYGGINQLVLDHTKIWKPPLIVKNEMNKIGMLSQAVVPLRIFSSGVIIWVSPITMNTVCAVDVQSYPFDRQDCLVELAPWGYSTNELNLLPETTAVVTDLYTPQGEWKYVSYTVVINNISDPINTYRTLRYFLRFERRWLFYSQYLLLPIMMNSVLMICVFLVPLDSGEKLGFSLTVLLSYVVLLTIVTDNLPPISTKTSVLQIYLSILMILGTVTTLLNIWVLTLYNKDENQRISACLQTFANYVIAPITCKSFRNKNSVGVGIRSSRESKPKDSNTSIEATEYKMFAYEHPPATAVNENAWAPHKDEMRMTCKEFAVVLDVFFFRIFLFGLFVLTLTIIMFFVVRI